MPPVPDYLVHLRPDHLSGCPVRPLGVCYENAWRGCRFYYRVPDGPPRGLRATQHGRRGIATLFAACPGELQRLWPKRNRRGVLVGWDHIRASETLMGACARRGIIDPSALSAEVIPFVPATRPSINAEGRRDG